MDVVDTTTETSKHKKKRQRQDKEEESRLQSASEDDDEELQLEDLKPKKDEEDEEEEEEEKKNVEDESAQDVEEEEEQTEDEKKQKEALKKAEVLVSGYDGKPVAWIFHNVISAEIADQVYKLCTSDKEAAGDQPEVTEDKENAENDSEQKDTVSNRKIKWKCWPIRGEGFQSRAAPRESVAFDLKPHLPYTFAASTVRQESPEFVMPELLFDSLNQVCHQAAYDLIDDFTYVLGQRFNVKDQHKQGLHGESNEYIVQKSAVLMWSLGQAMSFRCKQLHLQPHKKRKQTVTPKNLRLPHNSLLVFSPQFRKEYEFAFDAIDVPPPKKKESKPSKKPRKAKLKKKVKITHAHHINLWARLIIPRHY
jgi:hypothetical protein